MRKLASIQEISEVKKHPKADKLEIAKVLGWNVVVKKDEFKVGDKIIYFEVDSMIPMCEEIEFLKKSSLQIHNGKEYARIRITRHRKEFSEGLIMPLVAFGLINDLEVSTDVTEKLGVIKYVAPLSLGAIGTVRRGFHPKIVKTDEPRLQSSPHLLEYMKGKPYYITEKIDGTSVTFVLEKKDGEWNPRLYSRNNEFVDDGKSQVWNYFKNENLIEQTINYCECNQIDGIFLQGEFYGQSIQGNPLGVEGQAFKFFNAGDPCTGKLYSFDDLLYVFSKIQSLLIVGVEEHGYDFNYTIEELEEKAKGNYQPGHPREGIVVRTQEVEYVDGEKLSFKVLNKEYLEMCKDK